MTRPAAASLPARGAGTRRPDRARFAALALAALAALAGCTPLPPAGGLDVSAGAISDQWTVQFDPELGTPSSMTNRSLHEGLDPLGTPPANDSAAEAAVRNVFHQESDWFRLRPGTDDFRVVRSTPTGRLKILRLEQLYQGLSVAGAGYEARVLPSGRVLSITGRFYPDIHILTTPSIDASLAEERARSYLADPSNPGLQSFQFEYQNGFRARELLVIVPFNGDFVLAWAVVVQNPSAEYLRIYVRALDGTVFGQQYLGRNWSP